MLAPLDYHLFLVYSSISETRHTAVRSGVNEEATAIPSIVNGACVQITLLPLTKRTYLFSDGYPMPVRNLRIR